VTCDDGEGEGEGEGEVEQAHPIDKAHLATRQHATPRRALAPQRGFRGDRERVEDDDNSTRTPSPSSSMFNSLTAMNVDLHQLFLGLCKCVITSQIFVLKTS
jgi:hypothetical protein